MKMYRFEDVIAFYDRVQSYLLQHEAQHYILLGILNTLMKSPERYSEPPYLAFVEDQGQIVAIAIRTPPHRVVLSAIPNLSAVQLIVNDLQTTDKTLRGVSGLIDETKAFATAWKSLSGQTYQINLQLRIHQLDAVQPIFNVKGQLRLAEESDRSLLVEWFNAFSHEANPTDSPRTEELVAFHLSRKNLYVWQDQVPVSLVGSGQTASGNGRIGPVYTPPEHRRNGYASASVAAVSQILLDQGSRFCYLFTDITNPTSNHIYKVVGYQPICDWHEYTFG